MELNTVKYTLSYTLSQVFKTLDQIILKFPDEKLNFKPHKKSMSAGHLSCHAYNMCHLYAFGPLNGKFDYLEFDKIPIDPRKVKTTLEIINYGKIVKEKIKKIIEKLNKEIMEATIEFNFSDAPDVHFTSEWGKWSLIGSTSLLSILEESIHHRGQLNLYLRLMGIDTVFIYN